MNFTDFNLGRFYNADCFDVFKEIPDGCVDMVLCDIPYGEVSQKSAGLRKLDRGKADRCEIDLAAMVEHFVRLCSNSYYVFCGTEQISALVSEFRRHGKTCRVGVWEKTNPSPMNGSRLWLSGLEFCVFARSGGATFNEHCKKALWQAPSGRSKIHPTEKPVALMERLIRASTKDGDLVLDNCAGSGTTAIACENLKRRWVCVEKEAEYYNKAVARLQKLQCLIPQLCKRCRRQARLHPSPGHRAESAQL